MPVADYEKLGVFYLGRRKGSGAPLLYDAKDLTTHAVCVGMTGSGKTGLCLSLLEEAAIDGIPAIVIDPKGDIANLLLTFPNLAAEDFAPWVNADEARNRGVSAEEFAAQQAQLWRDGLAKWDQGPERIQRLRDAADFAIYTPGSNAGLPVSVMSSFAAPAEAVREDTEALRDRVATAASSLLGLAGLEADPLQSREHVLISALLDAAWRQARDLDLGSLIAQIQAPPLTKVGVMDLESFYPAKERFALAMALNNVAASPGFAAWMEGEPLSVADLLYTAKGKPRIAIFSIAHLSDSERMFFVSLLLNQVLSWVRAQSGTTSLRALLYMDEIFGYFPPTENPPSKKPLLTLLKQARAFGLGVVLATQNPVDLDYKGLGNTGTWFIGRLQTERDKMRVLEGLEGAAASAGGRFDRQAMEQTLAGLGNRVFLMNNVHEDEPVLFETRWCLSYLRGPLTREQIRQLMKDRERTRAATGKPGAAAAAPVLPPGIAQYFIPVRGAAQARYAPHVLGVAEVHFLDDKRGIDEARALRYVTRFGTAATPVEWAFAMELEEAMEDLETAAEEGAEFLELPGFAAQPKNYAAWGKDFATWIFRTQAIELWRSPSTKLTSRAGETERDFRLRLTQGSREERDAAVEKLRAKYAPKLAQLEERKRRAVQNVEKERQQAQQETMQSVLNIGGAILGAFLGKKTLSASNIGRATSAARGVGRAMQQRSDIGRAEETVEAVDAQIAELQAQFQADTEALAERFDPSAEELEAVVVRPKKTNIAVKLVALAWRAADA